MESWTDRLEVRWVNISISGQMDGWMDGRLSCNTSNNTEHKQNIRQAHYLFTAGGGEG